MPLLCMKLVPNYGLLRVHHLRSHWNVLLFVKISRVKNYHKIHNRQLKVGCIWNKLNLDLSFYALLDKWNYSLFTPDLLQSLSEVMALWFSNVLNFPM